MKQIQPTDTKLETQIGKNYAAMIELALALGTQLAATDSLLGALLALKPRVGELDYIVAGRARNKALLEQLDTWRQSGTL